MQIKTKTKSASKSIHYQKIVSVKLMFEKIFCHIKLVEFIKKFVSNNLFSFWLFVVLYKMQKNFLKLKKKKQN